MASFRATARGVTLLDETERPPVPQVRFLEAAYPDGLPYPETAAGGYDDEDTPETFTP